MMRKLVTSYIESLESCAVVAESKDNLIVCMKESVRTDKYDKISQSIKDVQQDHTLYCIESDREKFYQALDLFSREFEKEILSGVHHL